MSLSAQLGAKALCPSAPGTLCPSSAPAIRPVLCWVGRHPLGSEAELVAKHLVLSPLAAAQEPCSSQVWDRTWGVAVSAPSWGQPVPPSECHAGLVPAWAPAQGGRFPKLVLVRIPLEVPVAAERAEPVESEGYRLEVPG